MKLITTHNTACNHILVDITKNNASYPTFIELLQTQIKSYVDYSEVVKVQDSIPDDPPWSRNLWATLEINPFDNNEISE